MQCSQQNCHSEKQVVLGTLPSTLISTGYKMDDAVEELSSTRIENVIHHFECVLSHS